MIKYIGSKRLLIPKIIQAVGAFPKARSVLDLFSGTLSGSDTLVVTGGLDWQGGTQSGTGTTRIAAAATATIATSATKSISQRRVRLASTAATWTGGLIQGGQGGVLELMPGGVFDIQTTAGFSYNLGGAVPAFINDGKVVRSTGGDQP